MATNQRGRYEQAVLGTVTGKVLSQGNFPVLIWPRLNHNRRLL